MHTIIQGSNPVLGLFSGIHGDEWGIISSVQRAIALHKKLLPDFLYIPECSPSAVQRKTRFNDEGIDLNRCFSQHPQSKEAQQILSLLQPHTFSLCVDFHEDNENSGVYIYDSHNIEGSQLLETFRSQSLKVAPLFSGIDDTSDNTLGGTSYDGYRVSNPPQKDIFGNFIYEGFLDFWALIEGKTKRWITLEVPMELSQDRKDHIVDIFFQTIVLGTLNSSSNL